MGLGKTLQTICILASVHHERSQRKEEHLASLIICPPTLTNHWYHEIKKYASSLKPVIYAGPVKERRARLKKIKQSDVVITSYDVVRNDAAQICANPWLYCVLDEGHLIKNAKSKVSQAVKCVQAFHRLILSGTPIQNSVLELWSLFDFLMPGFLGNESSFNERFARPVLASKDGKSGAKGAEAGALALRSLVSLLMAL
jgi:TATA-binding protein-associated factor